MLLLLLLGVAINTVIYGGIAIGLAWLIGLIFGLTVNYSVMLTVIAVIGALSYLIRLVYTVIGFRAGKETIKEIEDALGELADEFKRL